MVGRDARNVATSNGDLAAFYLQVRPDDSVGVAFTDVSGYMHSAFSPPGWIYGFNLARTRRERSAPWYNLAAVSDGSTLKMYVNNVLVASTDLTASGSPNRALAKGTTSGVGLDRRGVVGRTRLVCRRTHGSRLWVYRRSADLQFGADSRASFFRRHGRKSPKVTARMGP